MSTRWAILTYHSLDDSGSVLSVSPRAFAEHMRILHGLGARVVPLSGLWATLRDSESPAPLVSITFDDGFRSVYEQAFPVLQHYSFPATVFLVTGYCGKTNSWPTQPPHVERRPLLGWHEVREMSQGGIDIGAHTCTHPYLTRLSPQDVEAEMAASKRTIEDQVQRDVAAFAYPYGAYDAAIKGLAARHFRLACSDSLGFAGAGSDLMALERLDVYYLRSPALLRGLFSRGMRAYIQVRRAARRLRRGARGENRS